MVSVSFSRTSNRAASTQPECAEERNRCRGGRKQDDAVHNMKEGLIWVLGDPLKESVHGFGIWKWSV